ncbi:hypothetical protein, partial [Pantoea ananatis]|uniref:hypothetical protein n=1 Tax=Pantoea ananas TaxID=553 RepID=UPI001B316210
ANSGDVSQSGTAQFRSDLCGVLCVGSGGVFAVAGLKKPLSQAVIRSAWRVSFADNNLRIRLENGMTLAALILNFRKDDDL